MAPNIQLTQSSHLQIGRKQSIKALQPPYIVQLKSGIHYTVHYDCFYREVLPLFQKFKYTSVSYPTKFLVIEPSDSC